MIELYCEDNMDLMARYPDKYFDLAVCDPPYGIGQNWKKRKLRQDCLFTETSYKNKEIPTKEYFDELRRVSKDQIIFGYNYYTEFLGSTNYLIIWDKCVNKNTYFNYSQAEIAYTSIHKPIQVISVPWDGFNTGNETNTKKIHPHQKPIELYVQILRKCSKPGFKIPDTHMGSGSSVIACHRLDLDITASEIDALFFNAAKKRIDFEIKQQELFTSKELRIETLFDCFSDAV